MAGEAKTWWWNPPTYVTDSERVVEMVTNFAGGSRAAWARGGDDACFDSTAKNLRAGLLLVVAVDRYPIGQVQFRLLRPAR